MICSALITSSFCSEQRELKSRPTIKHTSRHAKHGAEAPIMPQDIIGPKEQTCGSMKDRQRTKQEGLVKAGKPLPCRGAGVS